VYANGGIIEGESCAVTEIAALLAEGLYSMASLVLIPSGYKVGTLYSERPTDSNGQLTFTRNSEATRVNSEGLVEKVRTNLILQSNTFSTTWINTNTTETSGQSGYDGTNNAWLLTATSTLYAFIDQSLSTNSVVTFSVYAKANTADFVELVTIGGGGANPRAWFNLSTGSVGTSYNVIDTNIEAISSGWYRCSITLSGSITNYRFYASSADNSTLIGIGDSIYIQDAQLEAGDIATDYIPTTTASVSVGPVANLPRLDYSGGATCPSLLLEPQRTNLALYSEQFDDSAWIKTYTTITANSTTSPNGYNNADKLVADVLTSNHYFEKLGYSGYTAGTHTMSIYAKAGGSNFVQIASSTGFAATYQNYNLSNGTKGNGDASSAGYSTSIEAIGTNGWYRITFTAANPSSDVRFLIVPILSDVATRNPTFLGNGTDGIYIWGAQLEAGSYATSYIPTLSTTVTRLADAAYKTGISSLIGQTEGTIFFEVNDFSYDPQAVLFKITGLISLQTRITNQIRIEGVGYDYFYTPTQKHLKIAAAYTASTIVIYINGTQVHEDTSVTITGGSNLLFNESGNGTEVLAQALLFKTRLTNAQLAELTTL